MVSFGNHGFDPRHTNSASLFSAATSNVIMLIVLLPPWNVNKRISRTHRPHTHTVAKVVIRPQQQRWRRRRLCHPRRMEWRMIECEMVGWERNMEKKEWWMAKQIEYIIAFDSGRVVMCIRACDRRCSICCSVFRLVQLSECVCVCVCVWNVLNVQNPGFWLNGCCDKCWCDASASKW